LVFAIPRQAILFATGLPAGWQVNTDFHDMLTWHLCSSEPSVAK